MASDDIFCKIIRKEVKSEIVMEETDWIAIKDIHPQAPVHILIIPKKHGMLSNYKDGGEKTLGKLLIAANKVAKKLKIEKSGFRLIINQGRDSQVEVFNHLHIHLLAGKKLGAKIVN
jgi:histidine triad (HIT) family protein